MKTGWAVLLEEGEVGFICSRSGLALSGVMVVNSPGVIDAGYLGELTVVLGTLAKESYEILPGMSVAQLVICRHQDVKLFGDTRNQKGFGSSG